MRRSRASAGQPAVTRRGVMASTSTRKRSVQSPSERIKAYSGDLDKQVAEMKQRQDFLEEMTEALPDDVKVSDTVTDSTGEAAKTVSKISALIPEAAALAAIEARQLAYVEKLTRYADLRADRAAERQRLGFDPAQPLGVVMFGGAGSPDRVRPFIASRTSMLFRHALTSLSSKRRRPPSAGRFIRA